MRWRITEDEWAFGNAAARLHTLRLRQQGIQSRCVFEIKLRQLFKEIGRIHLRVQAVFLGELNEAIDRGTGVRSLRGGKQPVLLVNQEQLNRALRMVVVQL
jgi:hypothetical protein